jgi:hypothetical protein
MVGEWSAQTDISWNNFCSTNFSTPAQRKTDDLGQETGNR